MHDLPEGYARLGEEMGELRSGGSSLRMPFGPSLPLHEGMEALRRQMARELSAWHARVAAVAKLAMPDAGVVLDDGGKAVARATAVLAAHIDTLLGLEPGWMTRHIPVSLRQMAETPRDPLTRPASRLPAPDYLPNRQVQPPRGAEPIPPDLADLLADCEIVRVGAGYITVITALDGTHAGLDILDLHRRSELLLGEVGQRPETLDGVPCKECEDIALERAEPPSDPSQPAMYSICASCRHAMTLDEYRQWSAWYAKWADGAGLECARCQRGYHDQCIYGGCQCMACGHLAA